MAPLPGPLEVLPPQQQQQQQHQNMSNNGGQGQVSLGVLVDFIVQRTYHELTILAELLPRKTDMDRKIEIFNFASRTRMLFIRLLSLVKWASSASKVDKCNSIMTYLERQATLFMDTADSMAKMARETLVRATLPNFHLPAAVEILTTGSYSRVPRCIRDRIVPPEPITASERRKVLLKLNQVIEHRLVTSILPLQMRNLKIADGRVTFTVPNEFQASLTLMGEGPQVPWRLLGVKILVEDQETGEGKALIHSMQVKYVEQLIQSRLIDNSSPLHDLYNTLHSLCRSLQLEVLHSQTQKLIHERLGNFIRVEEYKLGKCLTVSYWRELMIKDPMSELGYRFSVQVDPHDPAKPLIVIHNPVLTPKEAELAEKAMKSEHLSLERLLVHSIYVRTKARLKELKSEIETRLKLGDTPATLHGSPAILSIPILQPCLRSEQLIITIDTHSGIFLAHVPGYESNPYTTEIQTNLNEDKSKLESLVSQLRYWITKNRVHKTLQQLPASSFDTLPILFDLNHHPLKDLSQNRMYIRLHHHLNAIVIIEFKEKETNQCEMDYRYYFLWVKPASIEDDPKDDTVVREIPNVYLKALSMVELDSFLVTHGSETKVDVQDLSEKIIGKRKSGGKVEAPIKRTKYPAYFISDLAHVIAFANERIPFIGIISELDKCGVSHSGIEVEEKAIGLVIKITEFPKISIPKIDAIARFKKYLLSTTVRLQARQGRFWKVGFVFVGNPIVQIQNKKSDRLPIYFTFDVTASESDVVKYILQEWAQMVHLFSVIEDLADYLDSPENSESHLVRIKNYNFKELVLEYGPYYKSTVRIKWKADVSKFDLIFSGIQDYSGTNPHTLLREQLCQHLNQHRDLPWLGRLLHETYAPFRSIARLPTTPQMGVTTNRVNLQTFSVIPQSPTHVKIIFYNCYCLDIQIKQGGLVFIRDGAFSVFDQRKVVEGAQPIQRLKTFLMRYVDESAFHRRQSQTEDDNPPSPTTTMDDPTGGSSGLRFNTPHTPPSNPMTPASPHTAGFLQSPPSTIRNPSPASQPVPSPGATSNVRSPLNPIGSPFHSTSAQSPMAVGSPGLQRPSPRPPGCHIGSNFPHGTSNRAPPRLLPQRLWAGANPTPLTQKSFDEICKPSPLSSPVGLGNAPSIPINVPNLPPLYRFLGCVYLKRYLLHYIRDEEFLQLLQTNEPDIITFKVEGLKCRVASWPGNSFQSLHLKVQPDDVSQWTPDMLVLLERFFDTKVVAPPYRPIMMTAFVSILRCPTEVLKDMIQVMQFDLMPELAAQKNFKWNCRLCLTVPPASPHIMPLGTPGVLRMRDKMLLYLQFTRAMAPNTQFPRGQEPFSFIIPIIYDIGMNQTSVVQKESISSGPIVSRAYQHTNQFNRSGQLNPQRCTILPIVQELLMNFTLPNEGPMMQAAGNQQFPGGGPMPMGPGMMGPRGPMVPPNMMGQQRPPLGPRPNFIPQQQQQQQQQ